LVRIGRLMSDTYTILFDPNPNNYFKYALIRPDGTVCQWSPTLDNLSTAKGDYSMQSSTYGKDRNYVKLVVPSWVTNREQLLQLYPEVLI
jgi:hypothetical protein